METDASLSQTRASGVIQTSDPQEAKDDHYRTEGWTRSGTGRWYRQETDLSGQFPKLKTIWRDEVEMDRPKTPVPKNK